MVVVYYKKQEMKYLYFGAFSWRDLLIDDVIDDVIRSFISPTLFEFDA